MTDLVAQVQHAVALDDHVHMLVAHNTLLNVHLLGEYFRWWLG